MAAPLIRLADRIRALDFVPGFDPITMDQSTTPVLRAISTRIGEALRRGVPVIVGDNIAEFYYAGTDKENWDVNHDFPGLVPPFPQFWIEWCRPSTVRSEVHGVSDPATTTFPFSGVLVDAVSPEEGVALWGREQLAAYRDLVAGARWLYRLQPIGYARDNEMTKLMGVPEIFALVAGHFWLAVDAAGKVTKFLCTALSNATSITGQPYVDLLGHEAPLWIHPCLLTLVFLNLRNGTLAPAAAHAPVKFARSWERKHEQPLVRYHTVVVDPSRTSKPTLPGPGDDRKMPVHLVRGTLVTYHDEDGKRLFGKYAGVFFRPPHVRGNAKEGVSMHDYRVKAPRTAS